MVWVGQYDQEPGRASLNYVSLGVGFIIGLQVSGPLIDLVIHAHTAYFEREHVSNTDRRFT